LEISFLNLQILLSIDSEKLATKDQDASSSWYLILGEVHYFELDLTRYIVALYGLEVPCGDILVPAVPDFPATVSI
jgi:hypothetical protein